MYENISSSVARAIVSGVGYLSKSGGVTRLTLLSVHWAERITATAN